MDMNPLRQLRSGRLPQMVSWYDPRLLARVGVRTIVSSVFGQYADQRLMQAVTDPCDDRELCQRYDYSNPNTDDAKHRLALDPSGALWIDYVADVGDGFDATYTSAYLLAQDSLEVRGAGNLRHGEILIMGGDQCYPQATREDYKKRLLQPFSWAFSVREPTRKLFAIPGNHDWYDGLNSFDSLFCSSRDRLSDAKGNVIGGWQCQQHRSYWALRLPYNWWIWGADIQFSKYLDAAQVNYFEAMARQMAPGDNLVICLAEPSWMIADMHGLDEEENFFKITSIARARGARVVAVIAGDWHHYNRYYAHELDVHFMTSGGGGAFLHPTHVLKNNVSVRWPERREDAETARVDAPALRPGEAWHAREYDIRLKRNTVAAGNVVDQAVQDVQDVLSSRCRRQGREAQAPAAQAAGAQVLSEQDQELLPELRQPAVPVLQPGLRHLHRPDLLADHVGVPDPRHRRADLARQDRRAGPQHDALGSAAVHAALSLAGDGGVHQPDDLDARALRHAGVVRRCHRSPRLSPLCHQVHLRHGAFPGAPDCDVHAVAAGGELEQPASPLSSGSSTSSTGSATGSRRSCRSSSRP